MAAVGRGGTEGWLPPEYPGSLSGHRYLLIIISIGKLAWCIFQATIVISHRETVGLPDAPRRGSVFRFGGRGRGEGGREDDASPRGTASPDEGRIVPATPAAAA